MKHDQRINTINDTSNKGFGEDVDDFDEELAATMMVQSPGGFRNVPIRNRSPTVLTPPHSTPRSASPVHIRRTNSKKGHNAESNPESLVTSASSTNSK